MTLREEAELIIQRSISRVMPDEAVRRALTDYTPGSGKTYIVSIGKAGWQMAKAAADLLKDTVTAGVVVTKYDHVRGPIPGLTCYEGGHPVPDDNSFLGTQAAIDLITGLSPEDTVLFLVSGGGSALFEKPLIPGDELADITRQLLGCGADIREINTIRKRLSAVKGGRFARLCEPAKVIAVVLSDIIGDPLDMIASGPAYPDSSTTRDALAIVEKYDLALSDRVLSLLREETPKVLTHVTTRITGSVRDLCAAAAKAAASLGYEPLILTDCLCCEAKEAGSFLASIARTRQPGLSAPLAVIAGGETVVRLTGNGKGGRNQELALSAAEGLAGMKNAALFSLGSDGTDGPTDAAGGYADGETKDRMAAAGYDIYETLKNNNAYPALASADGLLFTGATGTNVNDVTVLLVRPL